MRHANQERRRIDEIGRHGPVAHVDVFDLRPHHCERPADELGGRAACGASPPRTTLSDEVLAGLRLRANGFEFVDRFDRDRLAFCTLDAGDDVADFGCRPLRPACRRRRCAP